MQQPIFEDDSYFRNKFNQIPKNSPLPAAVVRVSLFTALPYFALGTLFVAAALGRFPSP